MEEQMDYPPYVDAYGQIKTLFGKIQEAAVPPKFTNDFVYTVLGLKSTSYRAMIPLLKKIGFINEAQIPTQEYKDYRDGSKGKFVLAKKIKEAYKDLFTASEYANRLSSDELLEKLTSLLGKSKDDKTIPKVVSTFTELCRLADFENKEKIVEENKGEIPPEPVHVEHESKTKLGISYTINLNLPATTDVAVFDAIFKSLKENLLK